MGKKKRKKAMRRRAGPGQERRPVPAVTGGVQLYSYDISYDPIDDGVSLPPALEAQAEALYALIHEHTEEAIPKLEALWAAYPDVPMLGNWLSSAYVKAGDDEKARALAVENYEKNPEYLFARLNYAEMCLQSADYAEIPRIFNRKYDLKLLYPDRQVFHISEVVGFMGILGAYFADTEAYETAALYHKILGEIEPDHPQTRRLGLKLLPYRIKKMFRGGRF